jgi:hypothetical protein
MIPNIHANDTVQYAAVESLVGQRILIREAVTPIEKPLVDIVAYFTGAARVQEISALRRRNGLGYARWRLRRRDMVK